MLVKITGLNITLAEPINIPDLMNIFINWLHAAKEHPVIIATQAHLDLVTIHPFIDVNGRTSRLLMNLLLIQAGYPPAIILPEQRLLYINCLKGAQEHGDTEPFFTFIAESALESLDMYLKHAQATTT